MANVVFVISAQDKARGVLESVQRGLSHILQITAGNLLADGFRRITGAVMDMGSEILRGASTFQNLQIKYENMVARIMAADANRASIQTVYSQERIFLQGKELEQLDNLTRKYDLAIAQLPVMQERYQAMAESGNYSAAALELQATKIQQIQQDIAAWGGQIDTLNQSNGRLVEVATEIQTQTHYTSEYMTQSVAPAHDLLNWVTNIAVQSKFTAESMAQVLGYALGMKLPPDLERGLSSLDRAKELTKAVGDFSAGMGLDNESVQRIMYNFSQMSAAGKVTGRDLRDLATSLFPANDAFDTMAQMMGITREEAEKLAKSGEVDVTKFFDAFIQVANRDFPNAMLKTGRTIEAAMSNMKEFVTTILGAKIFGPILQNIGGKITDFIAGAISPEAIARYEKLGKMIDSLFGSLSDLGGSVVVAAVDLIKTIAETLGIELPEVTVEDVIIGISRAISGFLVDAKNFLDWLKENPKFLELLTRLKETFGNLSEVLGTLGINLPPVKTDLAELANLGFDTLNSGLKELNSQLYALTKYLTSPEGKETLKVLGDMAVAFGIILAIVTIVAVVIAGFTSAVAALGIVGFALMVFAGLAIVFAIFYGEIQKAGSWLWWLRDKIVALVTLVLGIIPMLGVWLLKLLGDIIWFILAIGFELLLLPFTIVEGITEALQKGGIALLEGLGIIDRDTAQKWSEWVESFHADTWVQRFKDLGHELLGALKTAMDKGFGELATSVATWVGGIVAKIQEAADALAKLLGIQAQADGVKNKAPGENPNTITGTGGNGTSYTPPPSNSVTVNVTATLTSNVDVDRLAYKTAQQIGQKLK